MDSVEIASARGNKWRVNKKNRGWHKRLHLRKTADQPPTMQSEDKHGPKEIAEEWEHSTVWPSLKKPPHAVQQSQQRTSDSGNTLRFTCSLCGDSLEYVPKDLLRHFEDKHRGSPPVFSCHMCTFSTHEFSYLQVHLLSHKDTFSTCNLCNDNVQRTWPEFSEHLTMCHCQNGNYACEMCYKFSTGDVGVFLEHMYAHNLTLDGVNDDLHTKDRKKFGLKATTETLRCQHCGYEASRKLLINKDIKAIHICPKDKQKKMKTEVHSIAIKPNDPIPKIKPRLTRSAVREMCWLTQDCLSLPGKEFLDKYCTLSDPQTTLEETQQFLMKSVAGETGDQKWTKALKSVFSNVPQDINLHPMSENGIMSDSSDLTVLTVKNKITVAQNGTTYAKKMKMMNSPEKETVEIVSDEGRGVVNQNGCQLNLNDHASCPQTDTILNNDASLPAQGLRSECTQTEENRENQDVKTDQEIKDCGNKQEQPKHEDGINISNESQEPQCISKVVSKSKRRNQKRKARCKKADKRAAGLPLKIVLKKNPVKEKQWVSQSSLSPLGDGQRDENHGLPVLDITSDENVQIPHNMLVTKEYQGKRTKAPEIDLQNPSEGVTATPQTEPGIETGSCLVGLTSIEMQDDAEKTTQFLGTDVDVSASAGGTSQSDSSAEARSEEISSENVQLQTSGDGSGCHTSDYELSSAADGATSSPVPKPVITPPGKMSIYSFSIDIMVMDITFCGVFTTYIFRFCFTIKSSTKVLSLHLLSCRQNKL